MLHINSVNSVVRFEGCFWDTSSDAQSDKEKDNGDYNQ